MFYNVKKIKLQLILTISYNELIYIIHALIMHVDAIGPTTLLYNLERFVTDLKYRKRDT